MRWKWLLVPTVFFYTTAAWAGEALSPYTGQERREIKALSKEEIGGYLSGDGMGFAKTAELNHYPGPRHVLELEAQLRLSDEQRRRTQAIFDEMKSKAVSLGKQLVEKEHLLDSRFAAGTISDAEFRAIGNRNLSHSRETSGRTFTGASCSKTCADTRSDQTL